MLADDNADELADRLRAAEDPLAMRTTRGCCAGVFTSATGGGLFTSEVDDLSLLGGRLEDVFLCSGGRVCDVDLFIWLRLLGVVLSRTTRFRMGLPSRLLAGVLADEPARDCRVSYGCELPDLKCLLSSWGPETEDDSTLRRLVRGGEGGGFGAALGAPSSNSALVRALSFMGTGISSSELSCMVEYCAWEFDARPGLESCFLKVRDGGRLRACLWEVLRVRGAAWEAPAGVGDIVDAIVKFWTSDGSAW